MVNGAGLAMATMDIISSTVPEPQRTSLMLVAVRQREVTGSVQINHHPTRRSKVSCEHLRGHP